MSHKRRGATLIELMVASFISGLLLLATIIIYSMGARAWAKSEAQVDLLQRIQLVLGRFVLDGQSSLMASVTVDPVAQAISLPNARDPVTARPVFDTLQNKLIWQRYCVYYYDAAQKAVFYREVDLNPPTASPPPIENYDDGSGTHPIAFYKMGGRQLAGNITDFQPQLALGVVTLALQGEQLRAGSTQPEMVGFQVSVRPRN